MTEIGLNVYFPRLGIWKSYELLYDTLIAFRREKGRNWAGSEHFWAAGGLDDGVRPQLQHPVAKSSKEQVEMEQVMVRNTQWRAGQSGVPLVNQREHESQGAGSPDPPAAGRNPDALPMEAKDLRQPPAHERLPLLGRAPHPAVCATSTGTTASTARARCGSASL